MIVLNTNVILLGRWTTYRFSFNLTADNKAYFAHMLEGLDDFGIAPKVIDTFTTLPRNLHSVWDLIDPPLESTDDIKDIGRIYLPFSVRYQLEVCISQGILNEYSLTNEFVTELVNLTEDHALQLLEHITDKGTRIFDPMSIFRTYLRKTHAAGM